MQSGHHPGQVIVAGTSLGHANQDHLAFYMDLVGHDILNSNQAALGYIELVLANPGCDSAIRAYAEKAFSHVRRSTMLVENIKRLLATGTGDGAPAGPLDMRALLERAETELSKFFPDRRVRVRLGRMPKEVRVLGGATAHDLVMNAMVSTLGLDPKKEAELRVGVEESSLKGKRCWTVTVEERDAVLPPALKEKDIESVYMLDRSVAVKLSGLLFSKMMAEALGGEFDAHALRDARDGAGAGLRITLRRADAT